MDSQGVPAWINSVSTSNSDTSLHNFISQGISVALWVTSSLFTPKFLANKAV